MTRNSELILHIGHYKTGTTALQVFLARNRDLLARQGLVYAQSHLKLAKHSGLAYALLQEGGVTTMLHDFHAPQSASAMWAELLDEARALPEGQALLASSEEFMRLGAHPAAASLLREILGGAPDVRVRVVGYLRDPQSHLQSWYNQLVKMGIPVPALDAAVRTVIEPVHWDYGLALQPWIDLVGPGSVILRQFRPDLRNGDALYEDFLDALDHSLPVMAETPGADPNPRLDERLLPILRGIRHSGIRPQVAQPLTRGAVEALAAEDGSPGASPGGGPGFAEIRERAAAGLDRLAALPASALDLDAMKAALPRPQDPGAAEIGTLVAVLTAEIARLRALVLRQGARISALEEQHGGGGATGDAKRPKAGPRKAGTGQPDAASKPDGAA